MDLRHVTRSRCLGALAAAAIVASVLTTATLAGADPPPNPTDTQLKSAQQQKTALANEVGTLGAQVAVMQSRLQQLDAVKELTEQKVAFALQKLAAAKIAATTARQNVELAQQKVDQAQHEFVAYVQAAYMNGDIGGTTGSLLTAADPNVLLEQSALESYQATHQLDAIGDMQRATVAKSNADAAARLAVQAQTQLTAAAKTAEQNAVAAVQAAQQQQQQLQSALGAEQGKLQAAQLQLATLNNERTTFVAYQKRQAEIRAQQERELLAREAAARAHSGGSDGPSGPTVAPGTGGSWTPQKGQIAVQRAERWLGTPYAWAGGNADGPTYGVCAGDGAFNDCNIVGFDCSGLVMYAWAQYPFAHYAATQYLQGSYHPSTSNLMPGDLVFWSSDGTVGGIHHVAIYIGGGMVIQAPESGEVIQETPLDQVDWGYFGATRPLT